MYEDQDYALAGRGGVGKTSILREMQRRLRIQRDPRAKRLVEEDWLTCPQDLDMAANMLARRIINSKHAQTVNCENLAAFMRRTRLSDPRFADGPIDLIIDEVDEILALDRRTIVKGARYPLMRQLRHARLQGSIRLTISGRDETETLLNDSRNPFALGGKDSNQGDYTRFKLLQIGALSDEAARELLLKPLRDLEYPVDAEAKALEKKLKNTRGIPVSIQSAGLDLANEAARKRVRTDSTV
ncbi:MAG: hypothetical protein H8E37_03290 [Planctomycetes bacterium]|nr:hypothetical protein [Planctomycetota bacterium]